jgi:ABC-2 type transport system permease protein
MIISSETGPITYIFGMAISELVSSLPALIILGVLAAIFIHTTALGWLMIIGSSLAIFFFSVSLGFLLANMSSDVMQSWASGSLLSMLLATIPPVYYPLSYLPYPYVYLAYLSPTTYVAQIAQYGAGLISLSANTLYIDWIAIIAISLVVLLIAIKKNRWREV